MVLNRVWQSRFTDVFLWTQFLRTVLSLAYALVILLIERVIRLVMFMASWLLPISLLDRIRVRVFGPTSPVAGIPRLFRGSTTSASKDDPALLYDARELAEKRGYPFEEHYVTTTDGYVLCLHRIPRGRRSESKARRSHGLSGRATSASKTAPSKHSLGESRELFESLRSATQGAGGSHSRSSRSAAARPVVFLMHGLCQCSEIWLCKRDNLAFCLADMGFDVWMGNARGNKYSCKHQTLSSDSNEFWDFCLDHMALYDLPANIGYILRQTRVKSLSYVGFSQGTSIAFAAFSTNNALAKRINLFVALGPAAAAKGFSNKILDQVAKSSPHLVFFLFGKRRLLSCTYFWQNLLSPSAYTYALDRSVKFLFGWDMCNVPPEQKDLLYAHLYSYTSVKSVVHWFQIMRAGRFQMFQNWTDSGFSMGSQRYKGRKPPVYPLSQIRVPIAVFYGGRDHLPDTEWLLSQLPFQYTSVYEMETYEHMDFLYAGCARWKLYAEIGRLCAKHCGMQPRKTFNTQESKRVQVLPSPRASMTGERKERITEDGVGEGDQAGNEGNKNAPVPTSYNTPNVSEGESDSAAPGPEGDRPTASIPESTLDEGNCPEGCTQDKHRIKITHTGHRWKRGGDRQTDETEQSGSGEPVVEKVEDVWENERKSSGDSPGKSAPLPATTHTLRHNRADPSLGLGRLCRCIEPKCSGCGELVRSTAVSPENVGMHELNGYHKSPEHPLARKPVPFKKALPSFREKFRQKFRVVVLGD